MDYKANYAASNAERDCEPQKPLVWPANIGVSKTAYFGAWVALVFGLIVMWRPVFQITGYGIEMSFAFNEIDQLSWMCLVVLVMNIVSISCLLIPALKSVEWKYHWHWSFMIAGASAVELISTVFVLAKKEELMENTLIGYVYELLSVELKLTTTGWILILTFILTLVCAIKMLTDAKSNARSI